MLLSKYNSDTLMSDMRSKIHGELLSSDPVVAGNKEISSDQKVLRTTDEGRVMITKIITGRDRTISYRTMAEDVDRTDDWTVDAKRLLDMGYEHEMQDAEEWL